MKIAIIVHFFPPKYLRGTEIATYNIARYLTKRGHDIHIITWLDKGFPKESIIEGFHVHRVFGNNIRMLSPIIFWIKIFLCLKKIKPDVIHAQNIGLGIPAYFAKKFLRLPYIIYGRGSDLQFPWISKMRLMQLGMRNADAIIALTQDMKEKIASNYNKEIAVIPNGIEIERFVNSKKQIRNINENKVIIYVGALIPLKGVKYLIQAMEIVIAKYQNVTLKLIGEGNDQRNLEKLVKELHLENNVQFIGRVANSEIPKHLEQADVFVLPSLSEGFPNVLLEAMAAGIPIITTNVGGLPEIVKNEENGFIVEPKNPHHLAEKILVILNDTKLQKQISNNNLKRATKYSWENVTKHLEEVYLKCL